MRARVRDGSGGPVLWIHGYTLDSSVWTGLWDRLPRYSHIGVDLPSHGGSASVPPGRSLAELGDDLAAAALARGVRHVIGLSLGTVIATQLLLGRPRSFATLCLGAPALGGGPTDPGVKHRYRQMEALHAALGPGPWMRELWMASPPPLFFHAMRSPALRKRLVEVVGRHQWEELAGDGVTRFATEPQAIEALGRIMARTLVLVGEHDFPAFRRTAGILRRAIPDCTVRRLPDTGHLCMLEAEDESATAIAAHLSPAA